MEHADCENHETQTKTNTSLDRPLSHEHVAIHFLLFFPSLCFLFVVTTNISDKLVVTYIICMGVDMRVRVSCLVCWSASRQLVGCVTASTHSLHLARLHTRDEWMLLVHSTLRSSRLLLILSTGRLQLSCCKHIIQQHIITLLCQIVRF